jgi:hypothetical protein
MANKKNYSYFFFPLLSFVYLAGYSQNPATTNNKVEISSPNAASLGKFGDIPVNYHTGIPNINIPIYTVKTGTLELPIVLSYHASGLKVQEQASWVGAGWALDAGGVITRTVMGAPDDKGLGAAYTQKGHFTDNGYNSYIFGVGPIACISPYKCPTGRPDAPAVPPTSLAPQDTYIQAGIFDGEPDLYFFNFNGHVGKFYFNDDGTPMIEPEQDLKIKPIYTGSFYGIDGFVITTPDGAQYTFGKNPNNDGNIDAREITYNVSTQGSYTGQGVTSSWFLNQIASADNIFKINLYYQGESYSFYTMSMFPVPSIPNPNAGAYNYEYDLAKNFINGVRLSKIVFPNGELDFTPGALRQDMSLGTGPFPNYTYAGLADRPNNDPVNGAKALGSISIKNNNTLCKQYNFSTSYFFDNSPLTGDLFTQTYPNNQFGLTSDQYRLRLDAIQESSCDNTLAIPPYNFTYNPGTVPRKLSFGIDHWGFYNGSTTNTGLIPTYTIIPIPGQQGTGTASVTTVHGADRDTHWPGSLGGALTQITYPTGGYNQFNYESNYTYASSTSNATTTLANMFYGMYGQAVATVTQNITVDPSTNSVNIATTNSSNYSATLKIVDNNNNTVYSEPLQCCGSQTTYTTQNTINLSPGNYQAILTPYSTSSTGPVQVVITQIQSRTTTSNVPVGGLRIQSTVTNDGITPTTQTKSYGYNYGNNANGNSSGILYSVPIYVQPLRNDAWGTVSGASCSPLGCFTCFGSDPSYYKSPSSIRPMAMSQGNHIGYGEVYVSQTNNGYSQYEYYGSNGVINGPWTAPQPDVCSRVFNTVCSSSIPNSPAPPLSYDPMRGELATENHFDQAGNLLKQVSYTPSFQFNPITTPGIIDKFYVTGYILTAPNLESAPDPFAQQDANPVIGGLSFGTIVPVGVQTFTEYTLQTAKKISDIVVTKTFDPATGNSVSESSTTYYNSNSHHAPTQIVNYTSTGDKKTMNFTNAFDFSIPNFNTPDPIAAYTTNLNYDNSYLSTQLGNLNTQPTDPYYYWQRLGIYTNYRYLKAADRQAFIAGRDNYASAYQTAHGYAKSNADAELKPILELQDEYRDPVIESAKWKGSNLLGATFTRYDYMASPTGIPYPQKQQLVNVALPSPSFSAASVSGSTISKDSRYLDETSYLFNNGNMVQVTPHSGVTNSYLYGYNSQYPVAKIIGSGNGTASALINQSTLDNPTSDATLRKELDKVRNGLTGAKALVTTYTYKPLVGISSETDPQGRTNYYNYDAINRLSYIVDQDMNVVKRYNYNYTGQTPNNTVTQYNSAPETVTATSTSTCGGSTIPAIVTYSEPAGAFTSFIDQGTADQLAINDAQAKAQAQANAIGCEVQLYTSNSSATPFNLSITNSIMAGQTFNIAANSPSSNLTNLPLDNSTFSLVPASGGSTSGFRLFLNGVQQPDFNPWMLRNPSAPLYIQIQAIAALINGASSYTLGYSNKTGSGTITQTPGTQVTVSLSGGGCSAFYLNFSIDGATLSIGGPNMYVSNSSPTATATFTMPPSGSVSWSANFSTDYSCSSGTISVQ